MNNLVLYSQLAQHLSAFNGLAGPPGTDAQIAIAEAALSCEFSHAYKSFLRVYGSAMVGPYPVYGVTPCEIVGEQPEQYSVVAATLGCRRQGWRVPKGAFVVSRDHSGNPVIARGARIYREDHDFGGVDEWVTFECYLEYCLGAITSVGFLHG